MQSTYINIVSKKTEQVYHKKIRHLALNVYSEEGFTDFVICLI